jgi:lysophospholipase L1-like esterase
VEQVDSIGTHVIRVSVILIPKIMKSVPKLIFAAMATWAVLAVAWALGRITADCSSSLAEPQRIRLYDLGDLQRYRDANSKLGHEPKRVVFFGDSIIYLWDLNRYFGNVAYVNRGIGGQTTADMLVRFRQDVIELNPETVVILGGINDFMWRDKMSDNDEQTLKNLESNVETMAELSDLHHIQPLFVSLLPVHNYTRAAKKFYAKVPQGVVVSANVWLKAFCAQHGYRYIDDYSAMVDDHGMLQKALSNDGIHPNAAGYALMAKVLSENFRE